MTVVDVHTHLVPDLPDHATRWGDTRWPSFEVSDDVGRLSRGGSVVRTVGPAAWDPAARLVEMDRAGVDRQVLSPLPPVVCDWGTAEQATSWARHVNESLAGTVAAHPDRFSGFGIVSLHHPDLAVAELEHAHDLGLRGVEIGTSAGGRELDDLALRPFFEAAERLGMTIFIHPLILGARAEWTDRILGPEVTFGLGMGTDTAIAATRLAFGGVTEQLPGLSICLAHGGGTFYWALARISRLWDRPGRDPGTSAVALTANIVVDSVVYDPRNLDYLVRTIGCERILFGTDYPLPAQDDLGGAVLDALTEQQRRDVIGGNALQLLGISAAPPAR